jgi:hypothetical protein
MMVKNNDQSNNKSKEWIMHEQSNNERETDYTITIIPGKYLINIGRELVQAISVEEVAFAILSHFHVHYFNEEFDATSPIAKEMCREFAHKKIRMLPLGQWKITRQELLEFGEC